MKRLDDGVRWSQSAYLKKRSFVIVTGRMSPGVSFVISARRHRSRRPSGLSRLTRRTIWPIQYSGIALVTPATAVAVTALCEEPEEVPAAALERPAGLAIPCVEFVVAHMGFEVSVSWHAPVLQRERTMLYHVMLSHQARHTHPFSNRAL